MKTKVLSPTIREQADAMNVPAPVHGTTVADLRAAGFQIWDDMPDSYVYVQDERSPTGWAVVDPKSRVSLLGDAAWALAN